MSSIPEFFIFSLTFCGVNEVDCANISLLLYWEQICYVNVCSKLFYNQTLLPKVELEQPPKYALLLKFGLAFEKRVGKKKKKQAKCI